MFNGEPVMRTRLEYLGPHVDRFYVCEQRVTFQGESKPELFIHAHADWFAPFEHKVVFVVDESLDRCGSAWDVEKRARTFVRDRLAADVRGLEALVVSVCDCDEIPRASVDPGQVLAMCRGATHVTLRQQMYYYNLGTAFKLPWARAYFMGGSGDQVAAVLLASEHSLEVMRNRVTAAQVRDGGWHLSYFMTPEDIRRKLLSFSHTEYSTGRFVDLAYIRTCMRAGVSLFPGPAYDIEVRDPSATEFPEALWALHQSLVESLGATPCAPPPPPPPPPAHTCDWWTCNMQRWQAQFPFLSLPPQGRPPLRMLEVGSFEGRSAEWFLGHLLAHPGSHLTCIDTFTDSAVEARARASLAPFGNKVIVVQGSSWEVLRRFPREELFDVVYVDGDQHAASVLEDALLVFPLLKTGGRLVFNNYGALPKEAAPNCVPMAALDAFLAVFRDRVTVDGTVSQLFLTKTSGVCAVPACGCGAHEA
jgi:predicted O-methyltransferase YrrM